MGAQDLQGLVDDVGLVRGQLLVGLAADEDVHPARVEVDEEAEAPAHLGQVLHGQAQAPRPRGAQHQPVPAPGEALLGQALGERRVVDLEVADVDAALGHAGGAAGLEDEDGLAGEGPGHPAAHGAAAQPLVPEEAEDLEVGVPADAVAGVEAEAGGALEPEGAARGRVEVPGHDLAHVGVEGLPGGAHPAGQTAGLGHGRGEPRAKRVLREAT